MVFDWCVIGFFFASGFVSVQLVQPRIGDFGNFLSKRFTRLLIPYFCFSWFYKSALIVLGEAGLVTSVQTQLPQDFQSWMGFAFLPAPPQIYFLLVLFFIQVAGFFIIHRLVMRFVPFLIALLWVLPWFNLSDLPLHGSRAELFPLYLGSYLLGGWISRAEPRKHLAYTAWFAGALLIPIFSSQHGFKPIWLVFPPWLFICLSSPHLKYVRDAFSIIGRYAGQIYVWHAPIAISAVTIGTIFAMGNGPYSVIVVVILTIVASTAIGSCVNRVSWLRPFHFK